MLLSRDKPDALRVLHVAVISRALQPAVQAFPADEAHFISSLLQQRSAALGSFLCTQM